MSKKALDIFKNDKGELGIVNINNMLPTPMECLKEVLPQVKDQKYKALLNKQITYPNDCKTELLTRVRRFQQIYRKGFLPESVKIRCCNFDLLEEKCMEYMRAEYKQKIKKYGTRSDCLVFFMLI